MTAKSIRLNHVAPEQDEARREVRFTAWNDIHFHKIETGGRRVVKNGQRDGKIMSNI